MDVRSNYRPNPILRSCARSSVRHCLKRSVGITSAPRARIARGESGQIAFYAAVILPVVVSISILTVDVSQWQLSRQSAQSAADRIALGAARLLPDQAAALAYVQREIAADRSLELDTSFGAGLDARPDDASSAGVAISSTEIRISLRGAHESVFDVFLGNSGPRENNTGENNTGENNTGESNTEGVLLRYTEQSSAQVIPTDVALVLSDSSNLRPARYQSWGPQNEWPASTYFNFVRLPCEGMQAVGAQFVLADICGTGLESDYRRWVTQSCFSPASLPLKHAALSLIELVQGIGSNRLAVFFAPGDEPATQFSVGQRLGFSEAARPNWSRWFDAETFISDEACAYFADPAVSPGSPYELIAGYPGARIAAEPEDQESCPKFVPGFPSGVHFPQGKLTSCYVEGRLTTQEAIYYRAARNRPHAVGASDLVAAIRGAVFELLNATPATEVRGNLAAVHHRKIVVLSEEVPELDQVFSEVLALCQEHGIRLLIVAFVSPELPDFAARIEVNQSRAGLLNENSQTPVLVLLPETPSQVAQLGARVVAVDREVSLKR